MSCCLWFIITAISFPLFLFQQDGIAEGLRIKGEFLVSTSYLPFLVGINSTALYCLLSQSVSLALQADWFGLVQIFALVVSSGFSAAKWMRRTSGSFSTSARHLDKS